MISASDLQYYVQPRIGGRSRFDLIVRSRTSIFQRLVLADISEFQPHRQLIGYFDIDANRLQNFRKISALSGSHHCGYIYTRFTIAIPAPQSATSLLSSLLILITQLWFCMLGTNICSVLCLKGGFPAHVHKSSISLTTASYSHKTPQYFTQLTIIHRLWYIYTFPRISIFLASLSLAYLQCLQYLFTPTTTNRSCVLLCVDNDCNEMVLCVVPHCITSYEQKIIYM